MELLAEYGPTGLFIAAFLAATILPFSSEVVLSLLLYNGGDTILLVTLATIGNVLGSTVNYWIGLKGGALYRRRLAGPAQTRFDTSLTRFERYGTASLLFAWVPVIGDPLTLVAGVLRIRFNLFLILVTIGKLGRYIAVTAVMNGT